MNAKLSDSLSATPADYVRHGLLLVPIPRGLKGPRKKDWNQRENCIADPSQVKNWHGNIGLAHAYSRTCAIDFDRLDDATIWLKPYGIDVPTLLNAASAVRISSGRENRAKLLYRLKTPLTSLKLADDALEFRCADSNGGTLQDLLPPSIHPDTGKPYQWEFEPLLTNWSTPPPLPTALLEFWHSQLALRARKTPPGGELLIPERRLGLRLTDLVALLRSLDPDIGYDNWLRVLMAAHHETSGSEAGFELVNDWSAKGRKYKGVEDVSTRWRSFKADRQDIVGAAWLKKFSAEQGARRYLPQGQGASEPGAVTLLCATDIEPEPISWLWLDWLARGKLHILAGAPGCGKTTIALKFAATITRGRPWPDGTPAPQSNVLIWSGEDDPKDTLLPRLMVMGANRSRIYFISGMDDKDRKRAFDPAQDMDSLRTAALEVGNIGFMIVDPIVNAVAGDSHKNSETRRSLQPVVDLAVELRAAVLGISHYTKNTQGRDPIERVTGSLAFGAVARIVMGAAKVLREDGNTERILVRAKSNIGPDGGGYEYTLEQKELMTKSGRTDASSVQWGAPLSGSAQQLLADVEDDRRPSSALADAEEFLRAELKDGRVLTKELQARAKSVDIAWRTVQRAKAKLGVAADRDGATAPWYWALPAEFENLGQDGQGGQVGPGCQGGPERQ